MSGTQNLDRNHASPETSTTTKDTRARATGNQRTFGNSRATNIAIGLVAFGFIAACAVLAFGGGSSTSTATPLADVASPTVDLPGTDLAENSTVAIVAPADGEAATTESAPDPAEDAPPVVETETETEAVPSAVALTDEPVDLEPEAAADEPATEAPVDEAPADEAPADEPVADRTIGPDSPPAPPGAPQNYTISSGGKLYLRGVVPTVETEAAIVAALARLVGPDNVISEFRFDPEIAYDASDPSPVFIDEKVLFESGSAEIAPAFYPIIAGIPAMQQLQPTVIVTIFGFTDSVGSPTTNLELSQQRVDAARDWIISQGGDGTRLIAVGRGEADPIADNDTNLGRTQNRRIEFLIQGFDVTAGS